MLVTEAIELATRIHHLDEADRPRHALLICQDLNEADGTDLAVIERDHPFGPPHDEGLPAPLGCWPGGNRDQVDQKRGDQHAFI